MFVPYRNSCWNPNLQYEGIKRRGVSLGVIRCEGGILMNGTVPL